MKRAERIHTERSTRAREILSAIAEVDPDFRRSFGRRKLRHIGSGATSNVFALGKDRVVKVISHPNTLDDCEVASLLWEEKPARGWPAVYDFAEIDQDVTYPAGWDDPVCVAVVERVTPGDDIKSERDQRRLGEVISRIDSMHEVHLGLRKQADIDLHDLVAPLDDEQRRWVSQLADGLSAINRWDDDTSLDLWSFSNFGLNKCREAVWVDFGV